MLCVLCARNPYCVLCSTFLIVCRNCVLGLAWYLSYQIIQLHIFGLVYIALYIQHASIDPIGKFQRDVLKAVRNIKK